MQTTVQKIVQKTSIFIILALALNNSYAASNAYDCSVISSDKKRLKCYDSFFKGKSPAKPATPVAAQSVSKPAPVNRDNEFGKELLASTKKATPASINSMVKGSFTNWKSGQQFTLENGQVWRIASGKTAHYKIKNPSVFIEKGAFGVYYMKVGSLKKRFKVKRIK